MTGEKMLRVTGEKMLQVTGEKMIQVTGEKILQVEKNATSHWEEMLRVGKKRYN